MTSMRIFNGSILFQYVALKNENKKQKTFTVCFSYFVLTLEMIRQLSDVSHFIAHKLALAAGFRPLKSWPWC